MKSVCLNCVIFLLEQWHELSTGSNYRHPIGVVDINSPNVETPHMNSRVEQSYYSFRMVQF